MSARDPQPLPAGVEVEMLDAVWQLARTPAGACTDPATLAARYCEWHEAKVPGTVASSLDEDPERSPPLDRVDWWYCLRFPARGRGPEVRHRLRFEGLATFATVWLNGEKLLESRDMFLEHVVDVSERLRDDNDLAIHFAATDPAPPKAPRARWRTALVDRPDRRNVRATLLGRMPGWTPSLACIGPWAPVKLERERGVGLDRLGLQATAQGTTGRLRIDAALSPLGGARIEGARLRLADALHDLAVEPGEQARVRAEILVPDAPLWWPHTHGKPRLLDCALEVRVDGAWKTFACPPVGFRRVEMDTSEGRMRFVVNGVPIFCRGASWTPLDLRSPRASREALREALTAMRDAGANMLRVPGITVYESADFYELCDELGLLVWQDFMFANMDYPFADAAFRELAEAEVRQQLERLEGHACIAAWCGGSEIAQQAAMRGMGPRESRSEFFDELLPRLVAQLHPGVPYFPSTPWGGTLPFQVGTGIAHYYGVGAYRRPISDVRLARVKFAAECLAFSNVPDAATCIEAFGSASPPTHDPRWKARVPRDNGAGWDFEDVRDHYLATLCNVDAVALRSTDLERYHALSRIVTGEVMRRVFAEWRSADSECGGALVWLLRDLLPGAGWGLIDSTGLPKAAYWYLKRAWAPRAVHITDEGLDGIAVHVVNDAAEALAGTVEIEMLRADGVRSDGARLAVVVPGRGAVKLGAEAMVGRFCDSAGAYRFGPPRHDIVVARLRDASGTVVSEDFHFPSGLLLPRRDALELTCEAHWTGPDQVVVNIASDAFLQAVAIDCEGFRPDDNHFHLAPATEKRVVFTAVAPGTPRFKAHFAALNAPSFVTARAARAEREAQEGAA